MQHAADVCAGIGGSWREGERHSGCYQLVDPGVHRPCGGDDVDGEGFGDGRGGIVGVGRGHCDGRFDGGR